MLVLYLLLSQLSHNSKFRASVFKGKTIKYIEFTKALGAASCVAFKPKEDVCSPEGAGFQPVMGVSGVYGIQALPNGMVPFSVLEIT